MEKVEKSTISILFIIFLIMTIIFYSTLFGLLVFTVGNVMGEDRMHKHFTEAIVEKKEACLKLNMTMDLSKELTPDNRDYTFALKCIDK